MASARCILLDPKIDTVEDMVAYMDDILSYQDDFDIEILPSEMEMLNNRLENFRIRLDNVDRLYYIDKNVNDMYYHLMIRDAETQLFVDFWTFHHYHLGHPKGKGGIFITSQARIFFKFASWEWGCNKDTIYKSMLDDGYRFDDDYIEHPRFNSPTLKFLCHESIIYNEHKLCHYREVLPKTLLESIHELILVREAMTVSKVYIYIMTSAQLIIRAFPDREHTWRWRRRRR